MRVIALIPLILLHYRVIGGGISAPRWITLFRGQHRRAFSRQVIRQKCRKVSFTDAVSRFGIRPLPFGTSFAFGIKVALVGIFAQSWDNFSVIYGMVTEVPDSVGASILALTGSGDEAGVYESLDNMVARITAYGDTIGDRAGWVFGAVLGAIFFVLSAVFAAVTAGIIAFARIVFALMIVIAPFMIVTSLFKPTQSLFEAWTRATIGYALMPVAAAGAAGVIVAIAEAIGDASADPGDVETVSLILPFLVILILSAGIMASVPYIASNLTGVVGIASNAVGLTGLARQGFVNLSLIHI